MCVCVCMCEFFAVYIQTTRFPAYNSEVGGKQSLFGVFSSVDLERERENNTAFLNRIAHFTVGILLLQITISPG